MPAIGFNSNVRYRGRVFHIQTEDSGVQRPHIITHLFADGGRILKTSKRSYAELVAAPDVQQQVRALMQVQHQEMVAGLETGAFDAVIDGATAPARQTPEKQSIPAKPIATIAKRPAPGPGVEELVIQFVGDGARR